MIKIRLERFLSARFEDDSASRASRVVALPVAFIVPFGAGVAMERLLIRWLYQWNLSAA